MGDYSNTAWILASLGLIVFVWYKRWRLGWDNFSRNPTTVQNAWLDWLTWVVPVLVFVMAIRNALVWLGMPPEWEALLWVMFLAYAIVRTIDYGRIAWQLRGVIATKEEMLEAVSVTEILGAVKKEQG